MSAREVDHQPKYNTNCDHGTYYNHFRQSCVRYDGKLRAIASKALLISNLISFSSPVFSDVCYGLKDGFHSDQSSVNCQGYISCQGGRLLERLNCGDQGAFDELTRKCIPSQIYNCPAHRIQTAQSVTSFSRTQLVQDDVVKKFDICAYKSNGFHIDARLGCRYYVKCTNGKTIAQFECHPNHFFDIRNKSCTSEHNRQFNDRPYCVNPIPSKDCDRKDNGFYTMPRTDCKMYFYCHNGKKTILRCQEGQVFDGRDCVTQSTYECPITDEACSAKADGYYKDLLSGSCRSYYYCANGKKLTYLCAENQFFDGEKCVLKDHQFTCGKSECANRPDGYYQNFAAGCRKYHYCLRGEKVTVLTCRDKKVFNGLSCVQPSAYNCASDTVECVRRRCGSECEQDGFFADYDEGCRSYYFCIAGNKTALGCSEGYVFNGESCVSELQYKCPKYCIGREEC